MKMKKKIVKSALALILLLSFPCLCFAEYGYAPADIQAKLFVKIFLFNNHLNKGGDIRIHVMDSPAFAAEIRKSAGQKIGKARIGEVNEGTALPSEKPSVLYLGDPAKLEEVIRYTRKNKILSITGIPDLVEKGITLGIGVAEKKPKILFNLSASEQEDMDWNPVILKISTIVK